MSGMQVISIEAERVKRLRAVTLKLDGRNLVVVGKPDAGKTTALDLLWMAFRARAIGPETISAGSDEARICIVIGNDERKLTVTRKLSRDGEPAGKLTVTADDGAKYGAKFLDTIISDLTFDPTEFARAEGKNQVDLLLQVVKLPGGVSIDALDGERAGLYEKRTAVNRDAEKLKAKLPAEEPTAVAEVSLSSLLAGIDQELNDAEILNKENQAKKAKLDELKLGLERTLKEAAGTRAQIKELSEKLLELEGLAGEFGVAVATGERIVAALADVDTASIRARRSTAIADAEAKNKAARVRQAYENDKADFDKTKAESEGLTVKIEEVDSRKKALLESVAWPIEGLGIRDGQVTYKDVILSQCGMSIRMRISCAIAMALNPKLKTIRIDEGESLGEEGRQELFAWAAERGFQVLMSVVKDGPAAEGEIEIIGDTLSNVPTALTEAPELVEAAA